LSGEHIVPIVMKTLIAMFGLLLFVPVQNFKDNTLIVRSKVATLVGDCWQTTTSILVSSQRLSSISIATNGIRTVSTARKN
jgi:hypothetical protein